MSASDARATLTKAIEQAYYLAEPNGWDPQFKIHPTWEENSDGVLIKARNPKTEIHSECLIRFAEVNRLEAMHESTYYIRLCGEKMIGAWEQEEGARDFIDAIYAIGASASREESEDQASLEKLKQFLAASPDEIYKPVPEEADRYRAVAEAAVKEKDYSGAIDNYGKALKLAPAWAEGHYNRALILAQQGRYSRAVIEMKKYLLIKPKAPNAQAAQDKIYVWESKK